MTPTRRRSVLSLALAAVLALSGCGGGSGGDAPAVEKSGAGFPVTVSGSGGEVTLDKQPTKIVSLSPTATEMLFAIGAGDQVAAVDDLSNYPPDIPKEKKSKLSGFKPNTEAIAAYSPDLVVLSFDSNNVVAGLKKLKIPVFMAPAATTLDDMYRQITDLGKLTGRGEQADASAKQIRDDITKLTRDLPKRTKKLTYYYELDPQLHTATSKTFIGEVFALAGLDNIADPTDSNGTGYPQLSAEYLIKADPDLVFLADTKCCGQSKDTVAKRAGWNQLTAVTQGRVVALDDDIASRWGPRVVELVGVVIDAVSTIPAA